MGGSSSTEAEAARFVSLPSCNHLILEDEPAFPRFLQELRMFLAT